MKELLRGESTISLEATVLKCPNAELYLYLYLVWPYRRNLPNEPSAGVQIIPETPCSYKAKGKIHPITDHEGPEGE
jgi:hypothetical protein